MLTIPQAPKNPTRLQRLTRLFYELRRDQLPNITSVHHNYPLKNMPFTCFPKLPRELRDKIWDEACCVTRVLDIHTVFAVSEQIGMAFFDMVDDAPIQFWTTRQRAPSLMHTCQEARSIGLQHYVVAFGTEFDDENDSGVIVKITSPPSIYVNWDYDIVCPFLMEEDDLAPAIHEFRAANSLALRYMGIEKRIRRFAINCKRVDRFFADFIKSFIVRNGMELIVYYPAEIYGPSIVPPLEDVLQEIVGDLVELGEVNQAHGVPAVIEIIKHWVASNWHKMTTPFTPLPRTSIRPMIMQPIDT